MKFELPQLGYAYDALEPAIDARTMELHHTKHHAAYVAKLNAALEGRPELSDKSIEALLISFDALPDEIKPAVRNHGGGHYNHSLFWKIMGPNAGGEPSGSLKDELVKTFTSFALFKEQVTNAALNRFGSGWAWLVVDGERKLKVTSTPNQDCPLMTGQTPILGLDVWEHAYYLKYQNRRNEYIESWWSVVNWKQVEENYKKAVH